MEAIGDVDRSTFDGVVGYKQLQEAPLQKGAGGPGVAGRGRGIQASLCEMGGRTGNLFSDLVERANLMMWGRQSTWGARWSILEQSRGLGSGRNMADSSHRM